jgi:hypothetical protein
VSRLYFVGIVEDVALNLDFYLVGWHVDSLAVDV